MIVRQMKTEECLQMLAEARLFRLACAFESQPYVVPVYAAYHEEPNAQGCLYGVTTFGQKIEWMRANPLVCVETDQLVGWSQWKSVVVLGRYVELYDTPEQEAGRAPISHNTDERPGDLTRELEPVSERLLAHRLLQDYAVWWEPAASVRAATSELGRNEPFSPIFYKIQIDNVSGYEAIRDRSDEKSALAVCSRPWSPRWINRVLSRMCGT